jgi:hypothetical protein
VPDFCQAPFFLSNLLIGKYVKSYFLEALKNPSDAKVALSEHLPEHSDPWVLISDDDNDPLAYFNLSAGCESDCEGPYVISADVSGRHYNQDEMVISLLKKLQTKLGGLIRDDFDNTI